MTKIMITGALGQIGSELAEKLAEIHGNENILITDIRKESENNINLPYEQLDVNDEKRIKELVAQYQITEVYHLAAMLSATAEKYPIQGWNLNTNSLLVFLELAREKKLNKIFWPSSIAVFGRGAAADNTPQEEVKNPLSMYGVAKVAGESFCEIYHQKYNVDVRSIRYPGLISWKTPPGGGTTDYAVDIYFKALEEKKYSSFVDKNTQLPMMYMDDAIRATIELMQAPAENISVRTAYNLQGMTFAPEDMAEEIKKHIPEFTLNFEPDFRQNIAESWPNSIDDSVAQNDWQWKPKFDLKAMTEEMLHQLKNKQLTNL